MKRLALVILFSAACGYAADPAPKANTVELNGHTFTLPDGFTIEMAAGPPLVNRPISADFDEQGRLYVSDSSGTNDKVQTQLEQKPHRVVRLESKNGDGKFDASTVYADKLMFPEGTMWLDGSLYVSAPPSIWKLTDTDGDGVADKREEWFKGQTLTGCANDLHGPFRGPDGWIYWCKGAAAKQTYERPGKPPFVTRAAHIFRARPDGTGIEPVMTGGMDNPVGLTFTPGGERIFCCTFFQQAAGGHRDGLVHAIYGGIYGKDHDPIYEHPWTSPSLMPVLTHLGPAAPAAVKRYESTAFGPDYRDNLFSALFNLHKVMRHVLIPSGSTFTTRDEDFVVSSNVDFHPTDVLEDADGSLLIVDTGGWYKLCCPTSQFHKPDVLGAIYRVRRKDAEKVDDPRGLKLVWGKMNPDEMAKFLDDPRPNVRRRAIELFGKAGAIFLPTLVTTWRHGSIEARRNAVWSESRFAPNPAHAPVVALSGLTDVDDTVRQCALLSLSVWRDRDAREILPELQQLLLMPSQANRRAAAEALGRIGDKAGVPALLAALAAPADRALEHSLTYALIEIGDRDSVAVGLKSDNARVRRAVLTALDQMPGGKLDAATVMPELTASDPALKETAWWIAGRHPEWGSELAGVLRDRIAAGSLPLAEQDNIAGQLAKLTRSTAIQTFLADLLANPSAPPAAKRIALHAMLQSNVRTVPEAWVAAVAQTIAGAEGDLLRDAVHTARALNVPKPQAGTLGKTLLTVGSNPALPAEVRLDALAAMPGGPSPVRPALFEFLGDQLRPQNTIAVRTTAADVISRSNLNRDQLLKLCEAIKAAGPLEVERLLDTFGQSTDESVGAALIAALNASTARGGLRVAALRPRLTKFGPAVQKQAEQLYASLNADEAQQKAKLEKLLTTLSTGDIRRGQSVFHGTKAACATCHTVGYVGGKLGPDLTKVGSIRTERDLLESIVFPSASFVRSYEPVVVTTKAGVQHNGILKKDAADELVVATGADKEVHVLRADVEEVQPSTVSVMPAGLDQQLTPQELADLIAFLKACK
jgi:putative membrane-bound dehydrogenase-like protein